MTIQSNNNINEVNLNITYSASDSNTGESDGRVFKKRRLENSSHVDQSISASIQDLPNNSQEPSSSSSGFKRVKSISYELGFLKELIGLYKAAPCDDALNSIIEHLKDLKLSKDDNFATQLAEIYYDFARSLPANTNVTMENTEISTKELLFKAIKLKPDFAKASKKLFTLLSKEESILKAETKKLLANKIDLLLTKVHLNPNDANAYLELYSGVTPRNVNLLTKEWIQLKNGIQMSHLGLILKAIELDPNSLDAYKKLDKYLIYSFDSVSFSDGRELNTFCCLKKLIELDTSEYNLSHYYTKLSNIIPSGRVRLPNNQLMTKEELLYKACIYNPEGSAPHYLIEITRQDISLPNGKRITQAMALKTARALDQPGNIIFTRAEKDIYDQNIVAECHLDCR